MSNLILLHPTYFPDILSFAALVQHPVIWEVCDNFQKQTYRNRCYICTDQGKHMLNIPVRHVGGAQGRQRYSEVRPENAYPWQRQHWRSLETAYRASPFFEYYEYELSPLYETPYDSLLEFNLDTIRTLCRCLQIAMPGEVTTAYHTEGVSITDARFLVDAKARNRPFPLRYQQVFEDRHGFIPNLSVLDLLFNVGPASLAELKALQLPFTHG